MNDKIVSVLFFVASAMAKGRGGGGGVVSIEDNWDAPAYLKVALAFEIIWLIASLVQLIYVFKSLGKIPSMSARGPYIVLALLTVFTMGYYLLLAIWTRLSTEIVSITSYQMQTGLVFLIAVDNAFRPAVILYLIHQRGDLLQSKDNATAPLVTQTWKRALDWGLVGLAFIFGFSSMAVYAATVEALRSGYTAQYRQLVLAYQGLLHTIPAFVTLLAIDVIVSLILCYVHAKRAGSGDLVITRLLLVVAPFVAIYAIESLAIHIYINTNKTYDRVAISLVEVILEGICRIAITGGVILTMSLPVQWVSQKAAASTAYPAAIGQQSTPNSGWSQPLYPQQQQQQQQFYPQPHPLYQQQQQYSHAIPTQPVQH